MRRSASVLSEIAMLLGFAVFAYLYRQPLLRGVRILQDEYLPCTRPMTFSVGAFDDRFKLRPADFQSAVVEAAQAWDRSLGKELFRPQADGELKINLIYDERQAATDKLKSLGFTIKDDEASYESLKKRHDTDKAVYEAASIAYKTDSTAFETRKTQYEAVVAAWNAKGGAPTDIFEQLRIEKNNLQAIADGLNARATELNAQVAKLNAMVTTINRLAGKLNKTADNYNGIVGQRGDEFQEGRFVSAADGDRIDIYEFQDRIQLVRVLTHEFGHALGLDHSENPVDVMYRLNEGKTEKLSAGDVAAVKARCRVK